MSLHYPVIEHRLDNGLRVVASPEHAVPGVATALSYGVGSRDETTGRTGQAHLFEHLMFEGSRNVAAGEHARLVQACGGGCNGMTGADSTVYVQQLPANAWELALWLEADRMATLPEALNQTVLDAQRAVVRQEDHERFARPYGTMLERSLAALFPPGHRYRHAPIGAPTDLDNTDLDDVRGFFSTFYRPNNAVLAVVGDLVPDQVFAAAERYFAAIPATDPPPTPPAEELGPLDGPVREDASEPTAPFPMVHLAFRLPPNSVTDPDIYACDMALRVLADGPTSRTHRRLVRTEQIAQQTTAFTDPRAGTSIGSITALAMPGVPADAVEAALVEELDLLADKGPSDAELGRCRATAAREVLGGLATCLGRAHTIADLTTTFGDPTTINGLIDRIGGVDAVDVQRAADAWLRPGRRATITFHPTPMPASAGVSETAHSA